MNKPLSKILISTASAMLSKKLFKDYHNGKSIEVEGFSINKILNTIDVKESDALDDDMFICFDDEINSIGIIKVGIAGYIMPIKDSSSTFLNLYKPMPLTTKASDLESTYTTRVRYEMPLSVMHKVSL